LKEAAAVTPLQRYALLGSPVAHSRSPAMQQAAFAAARIAGSYEAIDVTPAQLPAAIERLRSERYAGWNATTPLKTAMLSHVDSLTIEARDIGAINVVRREDDGRLTGHNTDGTGLVRALVEAWEWRPNGQHVLLLGSGPAAAAVAYALREAGATAISCWSRNREKALAIAPPPERAAALIISALPSDAQLPEEASRWASSACDVVDLNYAASRSPVGQLPARRRLDGLPLLLQQGALSFEWWTGRAAPLTAMRRALGL